MKKIRLYPAVRCRRTIASDSALRLLTATGTIHGKPSVTWFPIQSHLLTQECINEANRTLRTLRRGMLHDLKSMARACASYPDAKISGFWCSTYEFAIAGKVNDYRLRCMVNTVDFNFVLTVYEKTTNEMKEAA
ncbi:hypothetical protein D3Z52_00420 [Clostridiaceae bacterium]|jgi:hypothetical protein|nr:hypothetical protein [Clostridiaceae bacterium]NBI81189.1 hypothetical protein [Clostridiaceae bacterium]RKJ83023.1 hypothetical protein D7X33_00785 [Butyricicoccus sp. 1XD8-22]